ncbi:MAG: hypothetical protein E7623_01625 [Ruminococcaceae bacterium]|nr:hypothetical protein [Oscillospiraceae bacterium]
MRFYRCWLFISILCLCLSGCGNGVKAPKEVEVPILMFHDVRSFEGGTWCISEENFRSVLEFLLEEGYTPVSFKELIDYVDKKATIPEKPVCITLDDGYYSNYNYVLPIIEELEIPVTVFMTCGTVREDGVSPPTDENILLKMNADELRAMEASDFVSIQSHTYALHGTNTSYGERERDNALPFEDESKKSYQEMFALDCERAEELLSSVGVNDHLVLSYPSGKSCDWSEDVLKKRGYRVSITTDYGHINIVKRGDKSSLYLLGRMNVNDETTEEMLLSYLYRSEEK